MITGLIKITVAKRIMFLKLNKFIKIAFTDKFLLYTNISISFCLSGVGDVIEQRYEILTDELDKWNSRRTLNMSITGITVGTFCHYWYKFLDRRIPGHTISTVFKKILVDQFVGSPVNIFIFFGTLAILERMTLKDFVEDLKAKWWRLYVAEWVVWPSAQFINFYFVPSKYRVLYDNTISLGYDVYTSHVAHFDKNKKDEIR